MINPIFSAALVAAASLSCLHTQAEALPQELRSTLPGATLSGRARMTFWGFDVYQATLWVAPGFVDSAFEQSTFALELHYLRDFKGADIDRSSIVEMQRQTPMTLAQESAWEGQMRALFPDVKAGDRITGVHQPTTGAVFWSNGRLLGEVRDLAFARQFFGIWLSAQTSEPPLRRALLASAKTSAPDGIAP